jgi:hypothetical protein
MPVRHGRAGAADSGTRAPIRHLKKSPQRSATGGTAQRRATSPNRARDGRGDVWLLRMAAYIRQNAAGEEETGSKPLLIFSQELDFFFLAPPSLYGGAQWT